MGGDDDKARCKEIMLKDGVSEHFAQHVSHAIHSLSVEDIRRHFNKDVGENNSIPVGKNLRWLALMHQI